MSTPSITAVPKTSYAVGEGGEEVSVEGSVVLRDERSADGSRWLRVTLRADGSLRIEGQDLGEAVERSVGEGVREVEWTVTVAPAQVAALVDALGGGDDPLRVIEETCKAEPARVERTLRERGIPFEFWSRFGD